MSTREDVGRSPITIPENRGLYWKITAAVAVVWAILAVYVTSTWSDVNVKLLGVDVSYAQLLALALIGYLIRSVWVVQVDEFGALTSFGAPTIVFGPGLKVAPWLVFQRIVVPGLVAEEHLPAPTNELFHGDDDEQVPPGKTRAWRFVTGAPKRDRLTEVHDTNLLDVQMTVEMGGFVTWRVRKENAFMYLVAAGADPQEVRTQILGVSYALLAQEVSKVTVQELNSNLGGIANQLRDALEPPLERYGVDIDIVRLTPPNISHDLSRAVRDAAKARPEAVQKKVTADADLYKALREAEAEQAKARAPIVGRGEGIKQAAELMGIEPREVFAGQVAEKAVGEGDTIILGGETLGGLVGGLAGTLATALKNGKKEK